MDRKKIRLYQKLVILLICLIIIIRIITIILAKYESVAESSADVDIAFYLLKEDYKEMKLNLASLFPQDQEYVYKFSIGNEENDKVAEVNIEYELSISTTTNLPLTYELYKNQDYRDEGAINVIESNEIEQDEDGTYYRVMKTQKERLDFEQPKTNVYQLVIRFPANYNTDNYQDILEMLKISVTGQQII